MWMLVGTTLSNMAGTILNGTWSLPPQGSTGYILNVDDNTIVLGVWNDTIIPGTNVVNETLVFNDFGQQWDIGLDEGSGYFTIKMAASELFLTLLEGGLLTIEGM